MKIVLKALFVTLSLLLITSYLNAEDCSRHPEYPIHSLRELKLNSNLTLCDEPVPLDNIHVREMLDREFVISFGDKPQVVMWLKRSRRYFPYIEARLKERNLPNDLKYLAITESALRTHALSPKGAAGSWQFMKGTARIYGLRVNRRFDDRFNFYKSTDAAIAYLEDLYKTFDNWVLALAAYNCGSKRVKREIKEQEVNDYYRLNLPMETERFVFRILSAKIILSNPDKYGFKLDKDEYYLPHEFDRVWIDLPFEVHIRIIAESADLLFKEIKELNPEIRGYFLPKGRHLVSIPKWSSGNFTRNLQNYLSTLSKKSIIHVYKVKKGDSLTTIARRFEVSITSLKGWNNLEGKKFVHPGQKLKIYGNTSNIDGF